MTSQQVLAAAAVLREFGLAEISAFCDERPPEIISILASAAPAVEPSGKERWRVVDLPAVRREARRGIPTPVRRRTSANEDPGSRLELAEAVLAACRVEPSPYRRRVMVASAVNHLRQVIAVTLPDRLPWWTVDLGADRLRHELRRHPDPVEAVRLQLGVAIARLAEGNVSGHPVPASELIETVARFRDEPLLGDRRLHGLVDGFVDLATAQVSRPEAPVDRLIVAVARRRARARVERDLDAGLHTLEPLLLTLGHRQAQPGVHDLFETVGRLPDGRDHAVVYADLLHVVPAHLQWYPRGEPLPGALVEVVAEPAVSVHLRRCARALEADLAHSPFGSDTALIGQAAHVFQGLAEEHASLDGSVVSRTDEARSELLRLAKAPVWPPATEPARRPEEAQ
jgi:hypothetical protein